MRFASLTGRLIGLGSHKWAVHHEGTRRAQAGQDQIFLSIGEPDLPPPAAVVHAAVASLQGGRTRYSSGQGEPAAREAIAAHLTRRSGLPVAASQVVCMAGTQQALFCAMSTVAEAGDEVLVADPYYATYEGVVAATGATLVPVRTRPEDGFHLTAEALERAVTPRSRVLLLNSPGNPTGAVLGRPEVEAIGEVCARHDLWLVCDEVYADLDFSGTFCSPFDLAALRDRSVSLSSISKSHALPGFRSGWAAGPTELAPRLTLIAETMMFGGQPFLNDALVVALRQQHPEVTLLRQTFADRAETVVRALAGSAAVRVRMPEGGMFVMADVRATGLTGEQFAWRLLDEQGVVVMPGESFGAGGAGHVRLAMTVEADRMAQACRRIDRLASELVAREPLSAAGRSAGAEPA